MKTIIIFLFSFTIITNLFAQEQINKLTAERENLYRKYKEAESLSTGIFGNRSKGDMQTTIDALNEIIKKDNQILEKLKSIQQDSRVEFTNKYNDLIQQNNDLSQKNRELLELSERYKGYSKENHDTLQATEDKQVLFISLLTILIILSIVYMVKYFVLKNEMKKIGRN